MAAAGQSEAGSSRDTGRGKKRIKASCGLSEVGILGIHFHGAQLCVTAKPESNPEEENEKPRRPLQTPVQKSSSHVEHL